MGKSSYVVACISCLVAIYGAVKGIVNVRRVKRKSGVMGLFIAFATILSDKTGYGQVLLWMRAPGVCCNHSDAYRSGDQPQPDVHKTTSTV